MKSLPLSARIYIITLTVLTGIILAACLQSLRDDVESWSAVIVTFALVAVLDSIPLKIYGSNIDVTLSNIVKFAAVLLLPPPVVILATALGTIVGEFFSKRVWYKRAFNISQLTVTIAAVTITYTVLHQNNTELLGSVQSIFAITIAGISNFVVNSVLVSLIISFVQKIPLIYIWRQNSSKVLWFDLTMIPLGTFLAILWHFNPISALLAILPLQVVRHSYNAANQLQKQTHQALYALMRVIDERDNETSNHSERVSKLAVSLAQELGLSPGEVDIIGPAASLHDLGKVGMESHILFKPKKLDLPEREQAQRHAIIGGELLSKFPLFEKGALLVRHHHEWYDGTGYPDRLKGEEIPIGARIISVADAFEAMTEERLYRKAFTKEEAIAELLRCGGTQFDPRVVHALVKVMGKGSIIISEASQLAISAK